MINRGKEFAMIENERIRIYPAEKEQMERFILAEEDDELKKAYYEMLEGCLAHPDQWDWYAMWMIEKADGTFRDRTLCRMLQKAVAKQNPEEYEPWQQALMCAVGQKCDWTDRAYLDPILDYIGISR